MRGDTNRQTERDVDRRAGREWEGKVKGDVKGEMEDRQRAGDRGKGTEKRAGLSWHLREGRMNQCKVAVREKGCPNKKALETWTYCLFTPIPTQRRGPSG